MNKPIEKVNPRELLKGLSPESGKELLGKTLKGRAGYVPQKRPLKALYNTIRRGTTHLLAEGVRGGGKTALGEALIEAFGLPRFYQQCMSGLNIGDFLYEWDRTAQGLFVEQQVRLGVALSVAQEQQWTLPFLKLGAVLEAFNYAANPENDLPPVLIIDEIDKLDEKGEDFLLQILARGYADVPRLLPDSRVGILPEISHSRRNFKPIVLLTSNNMRSGVSGPLRSRGRYTVIKSSSFAESLEILSARVPTLSIYQLTDLAMLMKAIDGKSLKEKPAHREYLELAETLVEYGYERITEEVLFDQVDTLAKCEKDIITLENGFESICSEYIDQPDSDVVAAAQTAFANLEFARVETDQPLLSVKAATTAINQTKPNKPQYPMYPRREAFALESGVQ